jgi:aerobic C4-dicarboxylate transport protein
VFLLDIPFYRTALVNMIGNGVATLVVARWENELGRETLKSRLA